MGRLNVGMILLLFLVACGNVREDQAGSQQSNQATALPTNIIQPITLSEEDLAKLSPQQVMQLGLQAYSKHRIQTARKYYRYIIEHHTNESRLLPLAVYETGYSYYAQKKYQTADLYLTMLVLMKHDEQDLHILAARVLYYIRNKDQVDAARALEAKQKIAQQKEQRAIQKEEDKKRRALENEQDKANRARTKQAKKEIAEAKKAEQAETNQTETSQSTNAQTEDTK